MQASFITGLPLIAYDIYLMSTVLSALRSTELELAGLVRVVVSYR